MPRKFEMKCLINMTETQLSDMLRDIAASIERRLPPKTLFCLLVFDEPQVAQYIANCRRGDMIEAFRETANRLEAKEDINR